MQRQTVSAREFRASLSAKPAKPRKYRNVPKVVDGLSFDSTGESQRWGDLQNLQRAGKIRSLERQVPFVLTANGKVIGKIVVDFTYWRGLEFVAEDFKSPATITPLFKFKAKMLEAVHGVTISIVH